MADESNVVLVEDELLPIIPRFLEISKRDVGLMQQALRDGDLETVRRLGHSAKGAGLGYGIERMGCLGLEVERAAAGEDLGAARLAVEELREFLDGVTVAGKGEK